MQLLAKFKKILYMGFRATLNFWKFKVALNAMYRIFLNFAKSCISSCLLRGPAPKKRPMISGSKIESADF